MNIFRSILAWFRRIFGGGADPNPQPTPPDPAPDPMQEPACDCDTAGPITEPTRGQECPLPQGMDIRFLAWSPGKRDVVFIGANKGSFSINGDRITGHCFAHPDGGRYHYIGYRVPSSKSSMNSDRTGKYAKTYRLYFERRVQVP